MRKNRFSEERIIGILKEQRAGLPVADLCRKRGISDASLYTWRSKYGGMEVSDVRSHLPSSTRIRIETTLGFFVKSGCGRYLLSQARAGHSSPARTDPNRR